jgi:hypothetical protein
MSRASIRALAKLKAKAVPILAKRKDERERERFEKAAARDRAISILRFKSMKIDPKIFESLSLPWRSVHELNLVHLIDKSVEEWLHAWEAAARDHAIRVVSVFLKGAPKIDEPLHLAWRRVHEQNIVHLIDKPVPAEFFYERIVKDLPGSTPEEKLAGTIERVPDWLGYFCLMEYSAFILFDGYQMPNIEELERKWKIPMDDRVAWPFLPKGLLGRGDPEYRENPRDMWALTTISTQREQDPTPDEVRQLEELLTRMDGRGSARYYDVGRDLWPLVGATRPVMDGIFSGLLRWELYDAKRGPPQRARPTAE